MDPIFDCKQLFGNLLGDGYCHDFLNNEHCGYDRTNENDWGDCCQTNDPNKDDWDKDCIVNNREIVFGNIIQIIGVFPGM